MHKLLLPLLLLVSLQCHAGEWRDVSKRAGINVSDYVEADHEIGLIWHDQIVPSGVFLNLKSQSIQYNESFYYTYEFGGVLNDAMVIHMTNSDPKRDDTKQTIYIERHSDGSFYFMPPHLLDVAYFKVTRSDKHPVVYDVTLVKLEQ